MPRMKPKKTSKTQRDQHLKNDHLVAGSTPMWKPHLSQYSDQRMLTFGSDKDLAAAIDLLWTAKLRNLPHDTPDGRSLVVPAEAVGYFTRAGLRFTDRAVRCVSDLPAEEIRSLRK